MSFFSGWFGRPDPKAVWAIDIGSSSLKALRCRLRDSDEDLVYADAFDHFDFSQEPAFPVVDALKEFLKRNVIKNETVVISVPGQSALVRFIRLPPVEAAKVPMVVRYEAKQQIPFALEDVVWDWQQLVGHNEEDFMLDSEIGLFSIKRDFALSVMEPFKQVGIKVNIVQLAPVALHNFLIFDQFCDVALPIIFDQDDPLPFTVLLSINANASDLVLTNGFRIWTRSIPLGGNYFTKRIAKELNLSLEEAEQRKLLMDPAVQDCLKIPYLDLLTELQRSLVYFMQKDKTATINRVIAVGKTMGIPGLLAYLQQEVKIDRQPEQPTFSYLETFKTIIGPVTTNPRFRRDLSSFAACYGLAIQALGQGAISTNLLPLKKKKLALW